MKKSIMMAQKAFAQSLLDKGKDRAEATIEVAKKFDLKIGSAKAVVYRWFVGSDFSKKKAKGVKPSKKAATKKAPAKRSHHKKPDTIPVKHTVPTKVSVQPKRSHHKKPSFFDKAVAEVTGVEKKPEAPKTGTAKVNGTPAAAPKTEVWEL